MKLLIKSLLLTFILFLIIPINVLGYSNKINDITMDIVIDEFGDAHVTEIWNSELASGTENYKKYVNLQTSVIKDFTVTENNKKYTQLSKWDLKASRTEKAYKSGLNYIDNGVELCWGIGEYGVHTYTLNYTITNFVQQYNDYQSIFFTFFNIDSSIPNKIEISIAYANDFVKETTAVWGYGYEGVADLRDGKVVLIAKDLKDKHYMTILIRIPLGTFNTTDLVNDNFDKLLSQAEKGVQTKDSDWNIFDTIFNVLIWGGLIFGGVFVGNKKRKYQFEDKKMPKMKETNYWREIPCNKDIFRAFWVGYNHDLIKRKSQLMGSIILKWLAEDKIKVIDNPKDKKNKSIDFSNDFVTNNDLETSLKIFLREAAQRNDNYILEAKEFEKWSTKNYSKITDWYDDVDKNIEEKLIEEGIITIKSKFTKQKLVGKAIKDEAIQLLGLKRYLLEFSLIKEKRAVEVHLWQEYLIYAQLMGIADQVDEEFKKVYPKYDSEINMNMSEISYINTISYMALMSATRAQSAALNRTNGGGGWSSLGGGGGARGGGFGGGGFSGGGGFGSR